jgi:hypothetical protein
MEVTSASENSAVREKGIPPGFYRKEQVKSVNQSLYS